MDSIISELAAIPTLQEINLNYFENSTQIGNLDAFSNFHKIRVQVAKFGPDKVILELGKLLSKCPGLTELDISVDDIEENMSQLFQCLDQTGKPLSLSHLGMDGLKVTPNCFKLAIGNLRSLQSLHIHRFSRPWSLRGDTIWDILRIERVHIQDLSTDCPDKSCLRYLCSFNGLRKLSIMTRGSHHTLNNPNPILQTVIPHHTESLTELIMRAASPRLVVVISSETITSVLSPVKNLQYFALQLVFAGTVDYDSVIVSVFCNDQ